MNRITSFFKAIISGFMNNIVPAQCMKCGKIVLENGTLCDNCFKSITFLGSGIGYCEICNAPIAAAFKEGEICAKCLYKAPVYGKLRAAIKYNGYSKPMILAFKHGDRGEYSKAFAKWMVVAYKEIAKDIDLIIPVPLHYRRLLKRKYNQAGLLAMEVSKISGVPWEGRALKKIKNTKSQGHFRSNKRHNNVYKAFAVTKPDFIKNKRILLIDDVYTTGATTSECARTLLEQGAISVNILALAKT